MTNRAYDTIVYTARIAGTNTSFGAPACTPLLSAAEQAGVPGLKLESSCRNGTCRTCICQLLEGEVAYLIDWPGLSADEKRDGWILPCVAYARADLVFQLPR